jgi:hypothetical protein
LDLENYNEHQNSLFCDLHCPPLDLNVETKSNIDDDNREPKIVLPPIQSSHSREASNFCNKSATSPDIDNFSASISSQKVKLHGSSKFHSELSNSSNSISRVGTTKSSSQAINDKRTLSNLDRPSPILNTASLGKIEILASNHTKEPSNMTILISNNAKIDIMPVNHLSPMAKTPSFIEAFSKFEPVTPKDVIRNFLTSKSAIRSALASPNVRDKSIVNQIGGISRNDIHDRIRHYSLQCSIYCERFETCSIEEFQTFSLDFLADIKNLRAAILRVIDLSSHSTGKPHFSRISMELIRFDTEFYKEFQHSNPIVTFRRLLSQINNFYESSPYSSSTNTIESGLNTKAFSTSTIVGHPGVSNVLNAVVTSPEEISSPVEINLRGLIQLSNKTIASIDKRIGPVSEVILAKPSISSPTDITKDSAKSRSKEILANVVSNSELVVKRYIKNGPGYILADKIIQANSTNSLTMDEVQSRDAFVKGMVKDVHGYRIETGILAKGNSSSFSNYNTNQLQHLPKICPNRTYFHEKDYATYVGVMDKIGKVIASVIKEGVENDSENYRIILRIIDRPDIVELVTPDRIKKSFLGKVSYKRLIELLHKDIQASKLKLIEDKTIEARVLALDEVPNVQRYKFGVLLCTAGQTEENSFFHNQCGSEEYDRFLSCLGDKVELYGFKGYNGGLDTTFKKTGTYSIHTKWKSFEVMYHVSTLLPYIAGDEQQIERKRHLGNDIVNIIYLDGDMEFDPSIMKTQFTHIFIVVKAECYEASNVSVIGYRIAVCSNNDVPQFGPVLPSKSRFYDAGELHNFILSKLVNGENAAYNAPKFSKPFIRNRRAMMDDIVDTYSSINKADSSKIGRRKSLIVSSLSMSSQKLKPTPIVGGSQHFPLTEERQNKIISSPTVIAAKACQSSASGHIEIADIGKTKENKQLVSNLFFNA